MLTVFVLCRAVLCRAVTQTHRGNYEGPEPQRLATLKLAALKGAPYVDVEFKAAALFFAGVCVCV
jgi:hypothetical protein